MVDESLYLTTYEAALAVVATSMKKARLLLDTLAVNSLLGGILFTSGGMLHVMVQSNCPQLYAANPGIVHLLQGLLYPIGLFYVVILGADLFNSNILFFTVGLARGAVSILDLVISWMVSWWLNLVGTIFVCYVICHYSGVSSQTLYVTGSVEILNSKIAASFVQTLLKSMAGNFFVCLAIYLQLMAKPLHVKFLMMSLPIFTFVSLGFTHSVADMYMVVIGLINGAPVSVATVTWKLLLPAALGNIIGGAFFGIVIPWYLHLVVVERDQKKLHLPRYEMRDEQPELNQDSRVVRVPTEKEEDYEEPTDSSTLNTPQGRSEDHLVRAYTPRTRRPSSYDMSPGNVFPVYGMGPPAERERSIASGSRDDDSLSSSHIERPSADLTGQQLIRTLSLRSLNRPDLESQMKRRGSTRSVSSINIPRRFKRFSFSRPRPEDSAQVHEYNSRLWTAGVTPRAMRAANEAAGSAEYIPKRPLAARMARQPSEHAPESISEQVPRSGEASTAATLAVAYPSPTPPT